MNYIFNPRRHRYCSCHHVCVALNVIKHERLDWVEWERQCDVFLYARNWHPCLLDVD